MRISAEIIPVEPDLVSTSEGKIMTTVSCSKNSEFSTNARCKQFVQDVRECIETLRAKNPLTHCVTNNVVQEITANVLLAAGASPAMVVDAEEAEVFAQIASGVLVNIGTYRPVDKESMDAAIRGAVKSHTPWVLDPVAVGGLAPRTQYAREIVKSHPTVIRANASEILGLAGEESGGKGVDAGDSVDSAVAAAKKLVKLYGSVVAISGEKDAIYGHGCSARVSGGHEIMTKVVGTGCSLGALVAAYVGANRNRPFAATVAAHVHAAAAGTWAAQRSTLPGSFRKLWMDALMDLSADEMLKLANIEFELDPVDWSLYFITDPKMSDRAEEDIAVDCVKGGASVVQLRDKYADSETFNNKAQSLRDKMLANGCGDVPIFVDDRIDCAKSLGFNLHVGQTDTPYIEARKSIPAEWMVGLSIEKLEQLDYVYNECAKENVALPDVIGIGPIWPTATKPDSAPALGVEGVEKIAKRAKELGISTLGIGGVNENTVFPIKSTSIDGLCVVSALMLAQNPCEEAHKLRDAITKE